MKTDDFEVDVDALTYANGSSVERGSEGPTSESGACSGANSRWKQPLEDAMELGDTIALVPSTMA